MTDLSTLADRIEVGAVEMQRELLLDAFEAVFPEVSTGAWDAISSWEDRDTIFHERLNVGAYVDAAMMLVPEEFDWAVFRTNGGLTTHAWCGSQCDVFAATPALALAAAALRAHASEAAHG